MIWRVPLSIVLWALMFCLNTFLIILGWIVIPIAAALEAHVTSYDSDKAKKGENPMVLHFTWKWMFLWDNWEDGIANDMYWKAPNNFLQIIYWSCLRNPVNNLRRVPFLSVKIDPIKVFWVGEPHALPQFYDQKPPRSEWFFAWQDLYSNFFWQFKMFGSIWRFWIGWKIMPYDVRGVTDHRKESAGFASQFKRLKSPTYDQYPSVHPTRP